MATAKRVILVDGSGWIYRAYFAIPPRFTTASGLHTNAIYGFAQIFRKIFSGRRPDYGAVVFDAPGKTFRDEKFAAYKAERTPMADDLKEQLPWIDKLVEAHRFPLLRVPGYEADDVIGTLARIAVEAGHEVTIVSGDKDFAQLVSDQVKMFDPAPGSGLPRRPNIAVTYDAELVRKKWGVQPGQIVDLLALMGDKIDNIPGVPGIGDKGARTLLEKYGDLDGILAHTEDLKGRQKQTLQDNRDVALLSRELATIDRQVPLDLSFDDLRIDDTDTGELNALFRELEFNSLLTAEAQDEAAADGPDTDYRVVTSVAEARAALASLPAGKPLCVYAVHDLPSPVTGDWVGIAVATTPGHGLYLPAAVEGSRQLLAELLAAADRTLVTWHCKNLWIVAKRLELPIAGDLQDVMLASYLVEPTKLLPHSLNQIAKEYLQKTVPVAKPLLGGGQSEKRFSELDPQVVADFACAQADAIGEVWPIVEAKLAECGLAGHLRDVDIPLARVLGQMELDGIQVDPDDLGRLGQEFHGRLAQYEAKIYELAGHEFNIASPKQLSTVLFEELGLPVILRTKSGYSTNAEVLERLAPKHEIAQNLLEHRKLAKLINTYTDVLQRSVNPATGRIHATFQQTVAATGRLITTDPDLQRTPVKTPEGKRIRQAFIARPGAVLMSADWSQIELRLLAHFTRDALLVEAFRDNLDVHRRTAGQLFGCTPQEVTAEQRGIGKLVNFATIYGQGATALGQILSVPRKEAQSYIDGYFAAYQGVRTWLEKTIAEAHDNGFVTTIAGRRRYIPELKSKAFMDRQGGERVAANTPIQGSAADICKLAMLRIAQEIDRRGLQCRMLLQVHDELVFELPPEETAEVTELVRHEMEHVVPMDVPLVVDIGVGANWAEAH